MRIRTASPPLLPSSPSSRETRCSGFASVSRHARHDVAQGVRVEVPADEAATLAVGDHGRRAATQEGVDHKGMPQCLAAVLRSAGERESRR